MTPPEFDELVGNDVDEAERRQMRRAHDLLVTAGPPPELAPELAAGSQPFPTRGTERRPRVRSRSTALIAAALVAVVAFAAGYRANGRDFGAVRTVPLHATEAAPGAGATIEIGRERGENFPMQITVAGLPDVRSPEYYGVFLTRRGKIVGACGWFVVHRGRAVAQLNAPYKLAGTGWIVMRQKRGSRAPGRIVLRTTV